MRRARGWGLENALENGDSAGVSQSVENISVLSTSSHHHPSLPSPLSSLPSLPSLLVNFLFFYFHDLI